MFVGVKVVAKPLLLGRRWLYQVVERGGVCRGEGGCQAVVGRVKVAVAKPLSGEVFVGAKVVAKPLLVGRWWQLPSC